MNKIAVEVCVDNLDSLEAAIAAGADRIELCSALRLGGLTPTFGLASMAVSAPIPVYAMIRPRSGYFLYSHQEVAMMCDEIEFFKQVGVAGVVIGALDCDAQIDINAVTKLVRSAGNMGVTFHRAFDLVQDPYASLETLIDLGCERVLTSGCCATAMEGVECISELVAKAKHRLSIMPGCGVTQFNAKQIIDATGATEIHLSGKKRQYSPMKSFKSQASMGTDASNDNEIDVTDFEVIKNVVSQFHS